MFGKPKRKLAKGRGTAAEEFKAEYETRRKYPQMYEEGGKGALKKSWSAPKPAAESKAVYHTMRTKAVKRGLGDSASGIKTDEEKRKEE